MFKAAEIKEHKEFHGYFEIITQESEYVLFGNVFIAVFLSKILAWLSYP